MPEPRCGDCCYFDPHLTFAPKGDCHGGPPTGWDDEAIDTNPPTATYTPITTDPSGMVMRGMAIWPKVRTTDWCGQFTHRRWPAPTTLRITPHPKRPDADPVVRLTVSPS